MGTDYEKGTVAEVLSPEIIQPVVVVDVYTLQAGSDKVKAQLDFFDRVDDVYSASFGETIVAIDSSADAQDNTRVDSAHFRVLFSNPSAASLPSGPYFLQGSNIHQAWRIYRDDLDAFIFGVVPQDVLKPQTCVIIDNQNTGC